MCNLRMSHCTSARGPVVQQLEILHHVPKATRTRPKTEAPPFGSTHETIRHDIPEGHQIDKISKYEIRCKNLIERIGAIGAASRDEGSGA